MTPLEYLAACVAVTAIAAAAGYGYVWLLMTILVRGVDSHEWWRRP